MLEWAVAFIFTFYVISFAVDLLPAVHTKNYASRETGMQMEQNDGLSTQNLYNNRNGNGIGNSSNGHYVNGQNGYVANGMHYGNGNAPKVRPTNNF